jgi:hypothetical protein
MAAGKDVMRTEPSSDEKPKVPVEVTVNNFKFGEQLFSCTFVRGNSENNRAEEELCRLNDELRRLNVELERRLGEGLQCPPHKITGRGCQRRRMHIGRYCQGSVTG